MDPYAKWKGYQADFLPGFNIPMPLLGKWQNDIAKNKKTNEEELKFINFSSVHSISRKLPIVCACNIYREKFIPIKRTGNFVMDERLLSNEQFSTQIYSNINIGHANPQRKIAKGHMVRREDVQWDIEKDQDSALEASLATFQYSNACPQHQAINNGIWKELENSILIRGRSREPRKVIVFTGPVLSATDPYLVISNYQQGNIKCPLRFWKVVYFVNTDQELRHAAFIMSHKNEVEEDGFVTQAKIRTVQFSIKDTGKPFLDFDERETYQVNISKIESMTGLTFHKAAEALPEGESRKLQLGIQTTLKKFSINRPISLVEGLML